MRPSKYKAQLFNCGSQEKYKSCRYLKSAATNRAREEGYTVKNLHSEPEEAETNFRCELMPYSIRVQYWKFQQTPVIEKSVPVTPEVCNRTWREGIVTLPDLTTLSIRVGDSILYDYVPQGIIRVDSHVP